MSEATDDLKKDVPGVVAPPPIIYVCGLALAFALDWIWPIALLPATVQYAVGVPLIVLGFSLIALAFLRFRKAGTNVEPYKPTRYSLTSAPPGPRRRSRRPIPRARTSHADPSDLFDRASSSVTSG